MMGERTGKAMLHGAAHARARECGERDCGLTEDGRAAHEAPISQSWKRRRTGSGTREKRREKERRMSPVKHSHSCRPSRTFETSIVVMSRTGGV